MALPPDTPQNSTSKTTDRDAAQQEGFLREVDEAVRQDEMLSLARRYGRTVGVAIVAGLVALAGWLWWDHSTKQAAAERSEQTVTALNKLGAGEIAADGVVRDLEPLASDGSDGSKAVAAMLRAAITQQQGKTEDAAKAFASVAADASAPQPYRDLALIREVSIRFDAMKPEDVIARMKPMAVPGNPWFGSAGELTGLAYLKQGKLDLAGAIFGAVAKDKQVPETLRARMRMIAAQLGADAGDSPVADGQQ